VHGSVEALLAFQHYIAGYFSDFVKLLLILLFLLAQIPEAILLSDPSAPLLTCGSVLIKRSGKTVISFRGGNHEQVIVFLGVQYRKYG
jgi:hypothetical protein